MLFGLFFLSGAAALIYQTAWHRLLGLFAGADTIAAALVVGAFLLGLGIGSLVAGLLADRLSRRAALLAFALCEVGIAAFAVASPWLYYDVIYRELLPLSASRGVIFAVVFAGLLWPTFLMGCSLPFLSKAVVSEIAGSAKLIGWLYGLNTLGAGVGAFVGGWYLIGTFGFDKAVYVGAALNLVVAVGGLLLARGLGMAETKAPLPAQRLEDSDGGVVWRWSLLVFISGFLIVALQIVWYRLIGVLLQSNGYSFSLVLSVFLLGDAAGLLVGARTIDRIADPRRFFFLMQGIATALALAGAWFVYWAIGAGILPIYFVDHDVMSGRPGDIADDRLPAADRGAAGFVHHGLLLPGGAEGRAARHRPPRPAGRAGAARQHRRQQRRQPGRWPAAARPSRHGGHPDAAGRDRPRLRRSCRSSRRREPAGSIRPPCC